MGWLMRSAVLAVTGFALSSSVWWASRGPDTMAIEPAVTGTLVEATGSLRVTTLNVAHGRGTRRSQYLTTRGQHRASLDAVGDLLAAHPSHVIALQEVDGPTMGSGGFDHLGHLARRSGLGASLRGIHVQFPGMAYGASLLTSVPAHEATSHTFARTPPTPSKGFVIAEVELDGRALDVVSVHLDFARASARQAQVEELATEIQRRGLPLVLMGDLNMGWEAEAMQWLVAELQLHAFEPDVPVVTFPSDGTRLDWILASPELDLDDVQVLDDAVSDHRAVVGVVSWSAGT